MSLRENLRRPTIGNSCRWHRAALADPRTAATFAAGISQPVRQIRHLPQQPLVDKVTPFAAMQNHASHSPSIAIGTPVAKQTTRRRSLQSLQSMEAN